MALAPLAPLTPLPAPSITGGVSSGKSVGSKVADVALSTLTGGVSTLFGISASRLIAIIVGLIILAAAIFSFRPAREVIVGTAKTAAKAAAA